MKWQNQLKIFWVKHFPEFNDELKIQVFIISSHLSKNKTKEQEEALKNSRNMDKRVSVKNGARTNNTDSIVWQLPIAGSGNSNTDYIHGNAKPHAFVVYDDEIVNKTRPSGF